MKQWLIIILLIVVTCVAVFISARRKERFHAIPADAWHCLEHPQEMTLYSLDPDLSYANARLAAGTSTDAKVETNTFHEYRVLGQTKIDTTTDRVVVANEIRNAVDSWRGHQHLCFNPRHGVRVTDGRSSFDFLPCFECEYLLVFSGEQQVGATVIHRSPDTLNNLLRTANVPLAPPPLGH